MGILLRPGRPEDAEACGMICFEAFAAIARAHNFTPDFPTADVASGLMTWMLDHPGFYPVVAEHDGRIVGSNFLDKRNRIAGVGPLTVDPAVQDKGVGRRLMADVHQHASKNGFDGVRLVQHAYHNRSLSLYAKLGYDVREPLACLQGPPPSLAPQGSARPAIASDLDACDRLCRQIHGHDRNGELRDAIAQGTATVVESNGRVTGYATIIGFFGHAVGEGNDDLQALIGAATSFSGPGFLLPTRNTELLRWCLSQGLRVTQPLMLMTLGPYNEPSGAFLPSILLSGVAGTAHPKGPRYDRRVPRSTAGIWIALRFIQDTAFSLGSALPRSHDAIRCHFRRLAISALGEGRQLATAPCTERPEPCAGK